MYSSFDTEPLTGLMAYQLVSEGDYATVNHAPDTSHIATLGIYTCKAITLHNPSEQYGTMIHLNGTTSVQNTLRPIVDTYGSDITAADVAIVEATIDEDTFLWPSSESIANYFMQFNPRSLRIDYNPTQRAERAVALDLATGTLHEVDPSSELFNLSQPNFKPSTPLR